MADAAAARAEGTEATRAFYDRVGWKEEGGATTDRSLFGTREDGPIRQELARVHSQRVFDAVSKAGDRLRLLECGCGGHPQLDLLPLCRHYTGTDFSEAGLQLARRNLTRRGVPHTVRRADACHLPFEDGAFDAVYSAHMIYHIEDPAAQRAALREMMRVLRPGGVLVLIGANPRPLLFPIRLAKRALAETPALRRVVDKVRPKPPLPYRPMSIGWMTRELRRYGDVATMTHALPSQEFHQEVSEHGGAGRAMWKALRAADLHMPRLSAWLGSYVMYEATRAAAA